MKRKRLGWYLLIPPVYLGVIALFLYLQFSGRENIAIDVEPFSLRGVTTSSLFGSGRLKWLDLTIGTLSVGLAGNSEVTIRYPGGPRTSLAVRSYTEAPMGIVVELDRSVTLHFATEGGDITVDAETARNLGQDVEIVIPLSLKATDTLESADLPLLRFSETGGYTYLVAGTAATVDSGSVVAHLTPGPGATTRLFELDRMISDEDPRFYWLSRDPVYTGEQQYVREVSRRIDLWYASWAHEARTSVAALLSRDGMAVPFLAETLQREGYEEQVRRLSEYVRAALRSGSTGVEPALTPYLGYTTRYVEWSQTAVPELIGGISEAADTGDATVFALPRLAEIVLSHGARSLVDELLRHSDESASSTSDTQVLTDIATFYLDLLRLRGGDVGQRLERLATGRLIPLIVRSSNGTFVPGPTLHTIRIGSILAELGVATSEERLVVLGRNCVLSALSLAHEDGRLPVRCEVDGDVVVGSADLLDSHRAYPDLSPEGYLSRLVPLQDIVGSGSWIYTAARVSDVSAGSGGLRYSYEFPVGQTHHMIVQGIPEVSSVTYHGQPWRPDPGYLQYSDGWHYDSATRTMHIKCTQKSAIEVIDVVF